MVKDNVRNLSKNSRAIVLYAPPVEIGGKYWFPFANALFSYDKSNMEVAREQIFNVPNGQAYSYNYIATEGSKIVLSPFYAKDIAIFDIKTRDISFQEWERGNLYSYYRNAVFFNDKVFLLPGVLHDDILVLDNVMSIRRVSIANWVDKVKKHERTSEYAVQEKYLWVTAHSSNQVLKLDMETEKYELVTICEDSIGYTGIILDGEDLWLAESNTGAFVRYDTRNGDAVKYDAPSGLDYNSSEKSYVYMGLFDFENYVVSIPALCNKMTILNKETGKFEILNIDFFDSDTRGKENYKHGNYSTSSFGMKADEKTLWVQRRLDGVIACINIDDFTYSTFMLELSEEDIDDIYTEFYRLENATVSESGLISLSSFIHFLKETDEDTKQRNNSHHGADIWAVVK